MSARRILGIDPGLTRCGIGAIEVSNNRSISLLEVGVIKTPSEMPLEDRLLVLHRTIEEWILRINPDVIAVERVFSQHHVVS